MSQDKIIAYFGADVNSVEEGMQRSIRAVTGFSDAVNTSAKDSANAFKELLALKDKLTESKEARIFSGLSELDKAKALQEKLRDLVRDRSQLEKGSASYLSTQIEIERRLNQLGDIRLKIKDQESAKAKQINDALRNQALSSDGSALARNVGKVNGLFGEITRKFGAGKILESVLGGVGLGSGFAIAEKAAAFISDYWKQAAESAERIATASGEAADYVAKRIGLRETEEQALAKAERASRNADSAMNADAGDDPEKTQELIRNQQKYAYELEVLQKKAAERKKAEADKAEAEEKARKERDFQLQMDANERVRKEEAEDEKRKEDAATEAAEFFKAIDDAAAKAHEENAKKDAALAEEIAKEKYDAVWRHASAEQQLAQIIKEGREAQAKFDRTKAKEDELAVLKLKKRYDELKDGVKSVNDEKNNFSESETEKGGRSVGADGKIRRRGAIVSGEDAARSDATKARNARLNAAGMSSRITDSGMVGSVDVKGNKTDALLQQIRDSLKPKKI